MSSTHDSDYKLFFAHPEMVRDLLRDWAPGDWIKEADFSTLEHVNGSYVSEDQKQRHSDMVWRLRLKDRWLWVYLLLEFQSEPDPWMALRMLVYLGLLSQDLIKRGDLAAGKLPPILPLVLYNGLPEWKAPTEVSELFAESPPSLAAYRPKLSYHLIDEARLKLHPADTVRSAVEALFRLEHGRTPDDLRRVIQALDALLRDPGQTELRRSFTRWIKRLLRRKVKSPNIREIEHINDLLEADTMLAERIESWFDEATQKGLQKGLQQGIQQGMQQGIQQGMLKGQANILSKQLKLRFGDLPPEVVERLSRATQDELDAWGEAILSVPTLSAVFEASRH
ncbi:MAG: Rpn family recombination-promoting nuclease/putative transposase [Candidatus Accumulibacter sp.]|jgi:predicted transposase/invertase (TIGR01784 family)|nr:Rpn family recombination-promoting nuclease/putative transposase [Accumulibacter sp.]